jgi:hypothetical protein
VKYRETAENYRPHPSRLSSSWRGAAFSVEKEKRTCQRVKISCVIMAHSKRRQWAESLASEIGCEVVWDKQNDRHETGLRAITSYDKTANYHAVIQDDAILCDNFVATLKSALSYAKKGLPVSLYHGGFLNSSRHSQVADRAFSSKIPWLQRMGPIWGPAIVYPTESIPELADWFSLSNIQNYDKRVMGFYKSKGKECLYTIPSLVTHRTENNPSLSGHDNPNRAARHFAKPRSALEIDWSGPVLRSSL